MLGTAEDYIGFDPSSPKELKAGSLSGPFAAVSAAGNAGADPIIHHFLPESPSSSSFTDSPSYADSCAATNLSNPTPLPSTHHKCLEDYDYLKITVSNPQKESDPTASLIPGSGTFVSYLITTLTRASDLSDNPQEFSVRRRFRDVVTLADRIAESYRGFIIPLRPQKSAFESQVMHKHEFFEQRRFALEKYLYRLAAHPVIGKSDELRAFLHARGKLPLLATVDMASRVLDGAVRLPKQLFNAWEAGSGYVSAPQDVVQPAKGGRDLLMMFKELK